MLYMRVCSSSETFPLPTPWRIGHGAASLSLVWTGGGGSAFPLGRRCKASPGADQPVDGRFAQSGVIPVGARRLRGTRERAIDVLDGGESRESIHRPVAEDRLHTHPLFELAAAQDRARAAKDEEEAATPKAPQVPFAEVKPFAGSGRPLGARASDDATPSGGGAGRAAWLERLEQDQAWCGRVSGGGTAKMWGRRGCSRSLGTSGASFGGAQGPRPKGEAALSSGIGLAEPGCGRKCCRCLCLVVRPCCDRLSGPSPSPFSACSVA